MKKHIVTGIKEKTNKPHSSFTKLTKSSKAYTKLTYMLRMYFAHFVREQENKRFSKENVINPFSGVLEGLLDKLCCKICHYQLIYSK